MGQAAIRVAAGTAVRFVDAGQEAQGFIAIGQQATGFIAIGQLATGVIAIGQLARGVIVIGQLAIGVVAFGQLAVALTYGGGMVGLAGFRIRQSLLVYGIAGSSDPWPRGRRYPLPAPVEWKHTTPGVTAIRTALGGVVMFLVVLIALAWITDLADKIDPPEPPPPTYAPGTR